VGFTLAFVLQLRKKHGETSVRVAIIINLSKPSGFVTYNKVEYSKILHGARFAMMRFVRISKQVASFVSYIID
jgi:hypothetical protein